MVIDSNRIKEKKILPFQERQKKGVFDKVQISFMIGILRK